MCVPSPLKTETSRNGLLIASFGTPYIVLLSLPMDSQRRLGVKRAFVCATRAVDGVATPPPPKTLPRHPRAHDHDGALIGVIPRGAAGCPESVAAEVSRVDGVRAGQLNCIVIGSKRERARG